MNAGWTFASIPYHDPTFEESFYDVIAYYSPHELGNTVGPGVLKAILWYDYNYEIDVELTIVNPTKEELPIEQCIVVGIKTRNKNDIFNLVGDKTINEWSIDMFYNVFSKDWKRNAEKVYDNMKVKKYSVYKKVKGLMQRSTLITNFDGIIVYLGVDIQIPVQ